jgi:hypothetical protein
MTMARRYLPLTAFALALALPSLGISSVASAEEAGTETSGTNKAAAPASSSDQAACVATVNAVVRKEHRERLQAFCQDASRLTGCTSHEGRPIVHQNSASSDLRGKRILVIGMIHGDEPLSGEMALEWAERLKTIGHRNHWRVVPMLNPDGHEKKTRLNARGVDLNRNFPTKDWADEAKKYWKKSSNGDPRRFPGDAAASESETKCAIAHIKDFKPDFIVSVHTPYKVLDFDGPKMNFPRYKDLPWKALGNFPGSLGRFMWRDFQVPVLTVELGHAMVDANHLQDIVGTFAIEAARRSGQKTASLFDSLN